MAEIVVVEDEALLARQLSRALEAQGHELRVAVCGRDAIDAIRESSPDLVLVDLRLPDMSGIDVMREVRSIDSSISVVMMTAHASVKTAVEAIRLGAREYLSKPIDLGELTLLVGRLIGEQRQDRELRHLRRRTGPRLDALTLGDQALERMFVQVRRLAEAGVPPGERPPILITGETGTGKGMVAAAIHEVLCDGPFLEINCAAMPGTLIEAELFGHERGAFTDARAARMGIFEAAHGGTLFLDEIGELELDLQSKFLTAIENKRVRRVGSTRERRVDVHIIAATNRCLGDAVAAGRFRADLLHRLQVLTFELPPLRQRRGALVQLAERFAGELGVKYQGEPVTLHADAMDCLTRYHWPGNVRELKNVLERAVLLNPGIQLQGAALRQLLPEAEGHAVDADMLLPERGLSLEALERSLITQALTQCEGNRTRAAAMLGLTRDTLRYRLEKWGLK